MNDESNKSSSPFKYVAKLKFNQKETGKPQSKKWFDLNKKRALLPIWEHKEKFMTALRENQTLLLVGETGSGKTTQIPQWCVEYCRKNKLGHVACTQPRRVAAMSVAKRVAEEMNVELGQQVGYSVRFESLECERTVLKYMTDGMLLREAMIDSYLDPYAIIILDEAHERTLQTEILFGVVKRALDKRNGSLNGHNSNEGIQPLEKTLKIPLKVIVMSATVDIEPFKEYFKAPCIRIHGRQFPVHDMVAEAPQLDYVNSALISVFQIHRTCADGDILVFCTGQDEIESMVRTCKKVLQQAPENLKNLTVLPLYASLPAAQQMRIFTVSNQSSNNIDRNQMQRRVIFATNVAETSITIPNIKYVVDTGKVKCRQYCPKTGLDVLRVIPISKSQAKQRSGRAGRVTAGHCYKLYTQDEYDAMAEFMVPEIKRCNLDGVILQMISMGIHNINEFDFMDRPDDDRLRSALSDLEELGAIKPELPNNNSTDNKANKPQHNGEIVNLEIKNKLIEKLDTSDSTCESKRVKLSKPFTLSVKIEPQNTNLTNSYNLTKLGRRLSIFPLKPCLAKVIVSANDSGCLDEALTIISMLYIENLFHIPANKKNQATLVLKKFQSNEGDLIMFLNVFRTFKKVCKSNQKNSKPWCNEHFVHIKNLRLAIEVRKQLTLICRRLGMAASSCGQNTEIIRRCLCSGLFSNFAKLINGKYQTSKIVDRDVNIHPSSCLFRLMPEAIIYTEIVETSKCYMRNITLVDANWIKESRAKSMELPSL